MSIHSSPHPASVGFLGTIPRRDTLRRAVGGDDDRLQDLYLRLWRRWRNGPPVGDWTRYSLRCARNLNIDARRGKTKNRVVAVDPETLASHSAPDRPVEHGPITCEERLALDAFLNSLPPATRPAMDCLLGHPVNLVASSLDVPPHRLRRLVRRLRSDLTRLMLSQKDTTPCPN